MTAARQAVKLTPPPWGDTTRLDFAVLPNGRFITAGDQVRVAGRRGEWTFRQHCTTAKSEWLDVAQDGQVRPVAVDAVTVVRHRKASG
jgi:hypothetical protein